MFISQATSLNRLLLTIAIKSAPPSHPPNVLSCSRGWLKQNSTAETQQLHFMCYINYDSVLTAPLSGLIDFVL